MPSLSATEITSLPPPDYHWSPANQRGFLENLAILGNITAAANSVGMSKQAAYAFCARAGGAAFRLGWDAAILLARRRVEGDLLERALEGQEEIYERDPDSKRVTRIRVHNGLSMAMLTRLDRMVLARGEVPFETAMARVAAQDFDAFLDVIEAGGTGAAAMLFVQARDGGLYSRAGGVIDADDEDDGNFAKHGQLAQNVDGVVEEPPPILTPQEEAAQMSAWYCDYAGDWRTDFPPPEDFCGIEEGQFGDRGYERELSEEETDVRLGRLEAEVAPIRAAGEAARLAWFGLPESKQDFTQRRGDAEDRGLVPENSIGQNSVSDAITEIAGNNVAEPQSLRLCASARTEGGEGETGLDIEHKSVEAPVRPPPEDPNIRVVHCKPQPYYPGSGMIPPWAERIY